jgi:hypothetical protein
VLLCSLHAIPQVNEVLPSARKTLRIILSPDSVTSPSSLWHHIAKICVDSEVKVKIKAYGLIISGPQNLVDQIAIEIRKIDPSGIFICESAPSTHRHLIFQGFLQLSGEFQILHMVSQILRNNGKVDSGAKVKGKLVRCLYTVDNPTALLMDEGSDKVSVRCTELMLNGIHPCGNLCPYGELIYT